METIRAYCTICDTIVKIRRPDEGSGPVELEELDCPHAVLCGPADCAETIGRRPLREVLEFLPLDDGESRNRGLRDASRMVEGARRASFARERRRWIRWWGGR